MLSERIEKWSSELVKKGRDEGLVEGELKGKAEGRDEGKAELFLSLFEMKFGAVPDYIRSRIETANAEEILHMSERLLDAATKDDVLPND